MAVPRKKQRKLTKVQQKLVVNNIGIACLIAADRVYSVHHLLTLDELRSAAFYGLVLAARGYLKEKNRSFTAYAREVIHHEISRDIKLATLVRNSRLKEVNRFLEELVSKEVDLDFEIDVADLLERLLANINRLDNSQMKEIALLRIDGNSFKKIADTVGISWELARYRWRYIKRMMNLWGIEDLRWLK